MREIQILRDKIDQIDDQLLKMINRRGDLAIKIGREKSKQGGNSHFHVPHREREIIERLKGANKGPFPDTSVEAVFREVFSATLALEKPLNIAYLGPETTFTHQASIKQFGRGAVFLPHSSIDAVFAEVERGTADYGVVPIENSSEGVVNLTLDCFVDSPLLICDEIKMEIALYLLSKSKDRNTLKVIYSHPNPLAQCRNWLNRNLPNTERVETSSTASAAAMAAKNKRAAAISGKLAAEHYRLNIQAENIQDQRENFTRFLVIGKNTARKTKRNKTSIMFSIKDESGALLKTLQLFARHKINLTKIQSRPLRNRPWEYLFYLDFEGHIEDKTIVRVIELLKKRCLFLNVLGSYPHRV
ncbi:MAG: prephenate dehydratase [Nitrospinota bacterium]|nr:prephenate dehydratase [Nitrospinota bacterium]